MIVSDFADTLPGSYANRKYGLYGLRHHKVERGGDVIDAGRTDGRDGRTDGTTNMGRESYTNIQFVILLLLLLLHDPQIGIIALAWVVGCVVSQNFRAGKPKGPKILMNSYIAKINSDTKLKDKIIATPMQKYLIGCRLP